MKNKWIIKDWMNNLCFRGQEFDSFEDAWSFIYENDRRKEREKELENGYYDDYYVEIL